MGHHLDDVTYYLEFADASRRTYDAAAVVVVEPDEEEED